MRLVVRVYGASAGYEKPSRLSRDWRENDLECVPLIDDASEWDDVPSQFTYIPYTKMFPT